MCETLRARRIALGLRQGDVAEKSGHPEGTISDWETGRQSPRGVALVEWCQALGGKLEFRPDPVPSA
jgi:transcriptional regulator with XRE-family HTH domain